MDIIDQLAGVIPPKYVTYLTALFIGSQVLGRVYQAIVSGGGLKTICKAIWLGTNTPKQNEETK